MLPTTFHIPAALLLVAGGLLACFAGYRLFRVVLGIYGFILGALFAISVVSPSSTVALIVAIFVGGAIGAVVLTLGYFVGVALIGAGLGAMVAHTLWTESGWGDPTALPVLAAAVIGAILAVIFQRYFIIIGTAFGGAWTALAGAMAMAGGASAKPVDPNVGVIYSVNPLPSGRGWITVAWFVLGLAGVLVQLRYGGKRK